MENGNRHNMELTDREVRTIGEKRWLYKHRIATIMWLVLPVVIYFLLSYVSYSMKISMPVWLFYGLAVLFIFGVVRYIFGSEAAGKKFLEYIIEEERKIK